MLGGGSARFFDVGADGVRERGAMLGGGSARFFEVGADGARERGAMLGGGFFFAAFFPAFDAFRARQNSSSALRTTSFTNRLRAIFFFSETVKASS
ncbi:hypothetical protein [Polyangium spumosum]|uniref:Uncharacterized protein n=1 Tax=Polyangium spumosum TaxID=889282 RepID=A0A6N7QCN7_9BACT|nr:hypothetical protein [Polyangium spumosum]MRG98651.1 hypothetical protein [Polyangium spumosum]